LPRKRSILDVLITLPWWFNLVLAGIVYAGLKYYLPTIEFISPAFQSLIATFSRLAGLFACLFVFTAAISAYHAWRKGELLDRQTSVKSINALPWKDFEYLVGEAFRRQGYKVQDNTGSGADGGIDLVLEKDGQRTLVQCKNWRTSRVSVSTVRELYGVVTAEGAAAGILVCSGRYTKDAVEFAQGKALTLIDGLALARLIGEVQTAPKIKTEPTGTACPVCQSPMVLRTVRRGKQAGKRFWGCSKFPECRGTRDAS